MGAIGQKENGGEDMDIILKAKDKPVVDEMTEFLKTLTKEEQEQMRLIIKGVQLGLKLKSNDEKESA